MATININVTNASAFTIGRRGENEVTSIIFDYSAWLAEFGPGTVTLLVKRNTDLDPYPVVLSPGEDNTAIWLVTSTDTAYIGNGQAEFSYLVGSQIKKSIVYRITVLPDIIGTPSPEPPDPYETWIDTLLNLAGETQQNAEAAAGSATAAETAQGKAEDAQEAAETAQGKAEDAQEAAETAQGKAEDAQEAAETAQGKAEDAQTAAETAEENAEAAAAAAAQARTGAQIARAGAEAARDAILDLTADATIDANVGTPEVEVTVSTEDDHKVLDFAFKNLKGETGAQGETGPQGPAATVTVGTTTTGAAGSQASVNNSGTSSAAVLNFTIPKGDKGATGETGAPGADGITPTVTVTEITGGHNVAFDYGTGDPRNTDFDVMDGEVSAADLQAVADAKAPVIIDHAEGAIALFPDGAGDMPLKSCVINIEPIQDLHGYDNPWPAGGGKNKFQTTLQTTTVSGTTFTVKDDGSVAVSGQPSETVTSIEFGIALLPAGTYKINGFSAGAATSNRMQIHKSTDGTNYTYVDAVYNGRDVSVTLTEETYIKLSPIIGTSIGTQTFIFYPMIRSDSVTDDTFAPYSNICPISGWTGANILRVGFNFFDKTNATVYNRYLGNQGSGDAWISASDSRSVAIKCFPNTTYYIYTNGLTPTVCRAGDIAGDLPTGTERIYLNKNFSSITSGQSGFSYTTSANADWLIIQGNKALFDNNSFQNALCVSFSSSRNGEYEPYSGSSLTIPFGQTVYGGNASYEGNGVWRITPFPEYDSYNGETLVGPWQSSIDKYVAGTSPTIGAQVVDKGGADPSFTITTAELFDALQGQNNVWADTGDISLDYPCDTKLFIEKLTMPTEDDMVANSVITSGQYFMIGNSLYVALANIASGAQITVGTNAQRVSLADALNAINS